MAHFPSLNSTLTTAVASPTAVVARMCPSASPSSSCPSSSSSCSAASESVARSLCAWLCCSRCCDDDNSALDARRGDGRGRRPTNKANYEMANAWEKGRGSSRDGMANFREENNVASGAIFPETQQRRKHSPGVSSLTRHSGAGRKVSPTILTDPPPAAGAETGGEKSSPVRNLTPSTASIGGVNRSSDGKRNLGAMEALHKFAQDLCSAGVTTTTTARRAKFHKHLLGDSQRKWHSLDSATERAERSSRSLPVSGRPSSQLSVQQQQQHLLRDMSPDQPTARISPIPEDAGGGGGGGPPRSQSGFNEILNMAVSNPDLVQFQLVLNDWFRRQCNVRTSAFLLNSAELNVTLCQVCGTELAHEEGGAIQCGDADYLDRLFDGCAAVASCSFSADGRATAEAGGRRQQRPIGTMRQSPVVVRLDALSEKLVQPLKPVLSRLCRSLSANGPPSSLPISLVGVRANCGFTAILLAVHQSEHSKEAELLLMRPHLDMMANLLSIFHNIEEQRRLAHQMQLFLCMTQNVFSSLQDMNQLVRNITKEAKALVHAEICSLFLLDKEHSELVAEVFEKNGTTDEYLTEIRMPLNQGIVGHVASTGQMMNVQDVYSHPNFYSKVDERTGFITRNILCFPIKDTSGNLVGVAELCNKIGRDAFTRHDEQIAATFAVYCAISISHCLLYRKLQEAHRRSHITAELLVQSSTLSIAPEDILRLTVRDIPSPDSFHPEYNQFHFVPRSIGAGDIYVEASLSMFKSLGFIDRYRIRRRTLARFLLMVQKGYRDVPYHNWSHAFAVAHFCYLFLRMPSVKSALHELERFALLVACLCHDIDHRGTTNAFQLQSQTPLAQLYSSEGSVLERHHFAQTVSILGMDECNIFDQLNQQQYQQIMDCIREVILATDIAAHLRKVERIAEMANDGFDARSDEHRYLFMCLLMTASDLSDQSKHFRHSKAIAENIYKEFFSQGDLEKEMGNRPIEMMDRERACVPKIQIEFMDTVALPVFRLLAQLLPELQSTHQALNHNRRCWMMLDQILQEQGLPLTSGGLNYLKDESLEEQVIQRVIDDEAAEQQQQLNPDAAAGRRMDALAAPVNVYWRRLSSGAPLPQEQQQQQQQQLQERRWPSGGKKYSLGQ